MMNSYSTKVYQAVFQSDSTVLLINALTYTFGILFTLTCTVFSDKIGRRKMLLISGVGQAIMLLIAATIYITTPTVDGTKTLGVGVAIVVVMFMFTFFYKPGWGATVWIYTSEIFPMSVRGTAFAICSNTQSIAGVVMGQAFPSMFANMGFKSFYVWMGVNILLVIAVYFWFPETKGVPLEEMDALFGGNGKTEEVINNAEEHQYPKSIEKVEIKHDSSDSDSV
jgi:MFS family permease